MDLRTITLSYIYFLSVFCDKIIHISYYLRAAFRLDKAWLILHNQFGENGIDVNCFYFVGVYH